MEWERFIAFFGITLCSTRDVWNPFGRRMFGRNCLNASCLDTGCFNKAIWTLKNELILVSQILKLILKRIKVY